jgi:hypothetical protein
MNIYIYIHIYIYYIYQWLRSGLGPITPTRYFNGTEIKPGKHSDTRITRIKP